MKVDSKFYKGVGGSGSSHLTQSSILASLMQRQPDIHYVPPDIMQYKVQCTTFKCSNPPKKNLNPVEPVELSYSLQEMWVNKLSDTTDKEPNPEHGTFYRPTDLVLTTQ